MKISGGQDHREDHVDLLHRHRGAEHEPQRGAGQRPRHQHGHERRPARLAEIHPVGQDQRRQRQHEQRRDQPAEGPEGDLLDPHQPGRDRRQQAILDLLGEGELDHQGQGHVLQGGEHQGQRHHPRQQLVAVAALSRPDLRQDSPEYEQEEDGLEQRLGQERARVVAHHHPGVALAERPVTVDAGGLHLAEGSQPPGGILAGAQRQLEAVGTGQEAAQAGRAVERDPLAVVDDRDAIAEPVGLGHVVRGQQDRGAAAT